VYYVRAFLRRLPKRQFVLSMEDAKTAETRQRRIAETVSMLREGRTQR